MINEMADLDSNSALILEQIQFINRVFTSSLGRGERTYCDRFYVRCVRINMRTIPCRDVKERAPAILLTTSDYHAATQFCLMGLVSWEMSADEIVGNLLSLIVS